MSGKYFGTDGIRDAAGKGRLWPATVRACGAAVGAWLAQRKDGRSRILIGRDPRQSGPEIREQLAEGIISAGHHLVDGGVLTTPAIQTLCREEGFDLAIVVSASHNPACDNGIKFFGADGLKLPDRAEEELEILIDEPAAVPDSTGGLREEDSSAGERYLAFLKEICLPDLDLAGSKIVLDCANGAGSALAPAALRRFGADLVVVGNEPDGLNINDGVGVFFVECLSEPVKETGAIMGMALDGDGDRVLLVDELGDVRDGDHMLGILAADRKETGSGDEGPLVTTVMANMGLFAYLKQIGVKKEVVPVGDRFVAARMQELDAAIGGEQSGHIIFHEGARWFGDGIYTALRILEVVQRTGRPLSVLCNSVRKFPQVLINVSVREKPPIDDVPELVASRTRIETELGGSGRVVLRSRARNLSCAS